MLLLPGSQRASEYFFLLSLLVCILKIFVAENALQKTQRLAFLLPFRFYTHTHIYIYILKNGREQKRDAHHAQAAAQAALVLLFDGVRDVLRVPLPKPIGCD